ncbi:MAG: hypothetical protein LBI62_04875 [Candidatus Accumulibacter sp.]|nr:hypothetical protein [Accumulibacter sp.]
MSSPKDTRRQAPVFLAESNKTSPTLTPHSNTGFVVGAAPVTLDRRAGEYSPF